MQMVKQNDFRLQFYPYGHIMFRKKKNNDNETSQVIMLISRQTKKKKREEEGDTGYMVSGAKWKMDS